MSFEDFEILALKVGLFVLISFMFFIMYDLTKKAKAGKFGFFIIFGVLGFGLLGFIIKEAAVMFFDHG